VDDMKNLGMLEGVEADAPESLKAFCDTLDKAAMAVEVIPGKYKELMALAVVFTTQCQYCIQIHAAKAREVGASDQEIAEVVALAATLCERDGDDVGRAPF
jgi:AhpD family alkylhydroperoxidase